MDDQNVVVYIDVVWRIKRLDGRIGLTRPNRDLFDSGPIAAGRLGFDRLGRGGGGLAHHQGEEEQRPEMAGGFQGTIYALGNSASALSSALSSAAMVSS